MKPPGQKQMPRLQPEEAHGARRADCDALHGAGPPIDTARKIDGEHRSPAGVQSLDHPCRLAPKWARKARAEESVDDEIGGEVGRRADRLERPAIVGCGARGIALQRAALPEQRDANIAALPPQKLGGNEAVPAVVAWAGDDEDAPLLRHVPCRLGDRRPRVQHERIARRPARNRPAVGLAHFGGGQELKGRHRDYPSSICLLSVQIAHNRRHAKREFAADFLRK